MKQIVRNIKRTYKNKIAALAILGIGMIPVWCFNDGTFLLFALIVFLPLFFAKENYIY